MQALLRVRDDLLLPVAGHSYAALCASVQQCLLAHGLAVGAEPLVLRCSFAACALQSAHDTAWQQQQQQHQQHVLYSAHGDDARVHDDAATAAVAAALLARAGVDAGAATETCVCSQRSFDAAVWQWRQLSQHHAAAATAAADDTSNNNDNNTAKASSGATRQPPLPVLSIVHTYASPHATTADGTRTPPAAGAQRRRQQGRQQRQCDDKVDDASGLVHTPTSRRDANNNNNNNSSKQHWLSRYCSAVQAQHDGEQAAHAGRRSSALVLAQRTRGDGDVVRRQDYNNSNNNKDDGNGDLSVTLRVYDVHGTLRGHVRLNLLSPRQSSPSPSPAALLSFVSGDELMWLVRTSLALTLRTPVRVAFGVDDDARRHARCGHDAATHCHVVITLDDDAGDDEDVCSDDDAGGGCRCCRHRGGACRDHCSDVRVAVHAHTPTVRPSAAMQPLEHDDDARALLHALLRYGAMHVYLIAVEQRNDDAHTATAVAAAAAAAAPRPATAAAAAQPRQRRMLYEQRPHHHHNDDNDDDNNKRSLTPRQQRRLSNSNSVGNSVGSLSSRALVVVRCELCPLEVHITGDVHDAVLQWLADAIVLRACVPRHFRDDNDDNDNDDDDDNARGDTLQRMRAHDRTTSPLLPPATQSQLSPSFVTLFDAASGVVTHILRLHHYVLIDHDGKALERCIADAMARVDGLVPLMAADNNNSDNNNNNNRASSRHSSCTCHH